MPLYKWVFISDLLYQHIQYSGFKILYPQYLDMYCAEKKWRQRFFSKKLLFYYSTIAQIIDTKQVYYWIKRIKNCWIHDEFVSNPW